MPFQEGHTQAAIKGFAIAERFIKNNQQETAHPFNRGGCARKDPMRTVWNLFLQLPDWD